MLEAPRESVHGQILNVGAPDANYQIREIAEIVGDVFPGCEVTVGERGADLAAIGSPSTRSTICSRRSASSGTRSGAPGKCWMSSHGSI